MVGGRGGRRSVESDQELSKVVSRGIWKEKKNRIQGLNRLAEVKLDQISKLPDPEQFHEKVEAVTISRGLAWDDLTGMRLDGQKVMEARGKEVDYIRGKKVWIKIPRSTAVAKGIKIVKGRWIDINKGDDENPMYRSRYVGKEFNDGSMDGLFAGTPPLESLRYLVHEAATVSQKKRKVMMICDVSRAFFEAKAIREVCVEIPEADMTDRDRQMDMVGLLKRSLYGTRDAANHWQKEVAKEMKAWGFLQGRYNPCLYRHPAMGIQAMVHGDDFVCVGEIEQAKWFRKKLEQRFEIKTTVVGECEGEQREARVLNRIIRVGPEGWEYEADQRHAEIIVKELRLEGAKAVSTPGEDEKKWEEGKNKVILGSEQATQFRRIAARANYLAADRPDLMYSVKEICRQMATPTVGGWKMLKRLGRYLIGHLRLVLKYKWQGKELQVDGYTDSVWAGCRVTGKSTSGGAIMIGDHFVKRWSRTQNSITLSSAEAELVAMCKVSAELLGVLSMCRDFGIEAAGAVYRTRQPLWRSLSEKEVVS